MTLSPKERPRSHWYWPGIEAIFNGGSDAAEHDQGVAMTGPRVPRKFQGNARLPVQTWCAGQEV
jgi:hypothetical protein